MDRAITYKMDIKEQSSGFPQENIPVEVTQQSGQLWIYVSGYGEKDDPVNGTPIGIEIWGGRLRVLLAKDINIESFDIIDMEGAKQENIKTDLCDMCRKCGETTCGNDIENHRCFESV